MHEVVCPVEIMSKLYFALAPIKLIIGLYAMEELTEMLLVY